MNFRKKLAEFRKKLSKIEEEKTLLLTEDPKKLTTDEIFRLTLSNVSDAVFITEENGIFTFICPNVNVIFGYSYKEAQQFGAIENLLGKIPVSYDDIIMSGEISNIEQTVKDKFGNEHIVLINIKKVDIGLGKILYTCRDITSRKMFERELEVSEQKYRNLANKIESIREDEKKQISQELHDEFGHVLTGLKLDLSYMKNNVNAEEQLIKKIESMNLIIDETIDKVRNFCSELRPSILDHFGLIPALEWQAEKFSKRTEIDYSFRKDIDEIKCSEDVKVAVFRIFQETLTNIARHSGASYFTVDVKQENASYYVAVQDNGIGINTNNITAVSSLGILGMKERANQINGVLEIEANSTGTLILLSFKKII